jgi:hypothetical protein
MNTNVIALILGAGLAGLTYHYIGRRIGYSNPKQVWVMTGSVFVVGYLVFLLLFAWVIHI